MAAIEISNELFFNNIRNIIKSGNSVELRVKGNSMHPTLLDGKHKVVLKPYRNEYLHIGVIALFVYEKKYILHRLVAVNEDQLIFQGDNLPYSKEHIHKEDIIAIAEFIITPTGKAIDCTNKSFYIKNKLWRLIYRCYRMLIGKTKLLVRVLFK